MQQRSLEVTIWYSVDWCPKRKRFSITSYTFIRLLLAIDLSDIEPAYAVDEVHSTSPFQTATE